MPARRAVRNAPLAKRHVVPSHDAVLRTKTCASVRPSRSTVHVVPALHILLRNGGKIPLARRTPPQSDSKAVHPGQLTNRAHIARHLPSFAPGLGVGVRTLCQDCAEGSFSSIASLPRSACRLTDSVTYSSRTAYCVCMRCANSASRTRIPGIREPVSCMNLPATATNTSGKAHPSMNLSSARASTFRQNIDSHTSLSSSPLDPANNHHEDPLLFRPWFSALVFPFPLVSSGPYALHYRGPNARINCI